MRAKVLVLGERHVAEIIAKDMDKAGVEPVFSSDPIPSPSDPNALSQLRELFTQFIVLAGKPPEGSAHAVHPGVSVWAERAEFPLIAQELGLTPICPPARVLSLFSNKLNLMLEADRIGIPHLVMGFDPIQSIREIEILIKKNKGRFPFILKSLRGGGGFGCFVLQGPEDLEKRVPLWIEQLRHNFGEAMLFAERYVGSSRHIAVPFVRFRDGRFRSFSLVDASLQCRYRKVIEFSPPEALDTSIELSIREWAEKLADHSDFVGVGSLEFLVDGPKAFLIEGIARLNTAFHLWERVSGTSAVAWQLAALGAVSEVPKITPEREWVSALAIRLYAEDPIFQLPQPGFIHQISGISEQKDRSLPGSRIELNLSVESHSLVENGHTGILGTIYVGTHDRKQVLTIARGVMDELWISGSLSTNERFLSELLNHPWVRENMFYAGFAEEEFIPEVRPPASILQIAVSLCSQLVGAENAKWIAGDQWVVPSVLSSDLINDSEIFSHLGRSGTSGRISLPEGPLVRFDAFPVIVEPGLAGNDKWQVRIGRWVVAVRRIPQKPQGAVLPKGERKLLALANGRVHSVYFRENTPISAHETVLVLETLGVLIAHALPVDAKITKWKVSARDLVQAGQELALFSLIS